MTLTEFLQQKITELDAGGNKKAAIEYFANHVEGVTRQKINGWKKSGNFPFEAAAAVFENEFDAVDEDPPIPEEDNRRVVGVAGIGPEEPASSEFTDLEGATLPPHAPGPYKVVRPQTGKTPRIAGTRHDGISVVQRRGEPAGGPEMVLPSVDPNMVAAVMQALRGQGWSPPGESEPIRGGPANRPPGPPPRRSGPVTVQPRKVLRARGWNDPRVARQ